MALATLLAAALAGCKSTTIDLRRPDGSRTRVTDRRCLWTTKADFRAEIQTNGAVKLEGKVNSRGDDKSIRAVSEGAAK